MKRFSKISPAPALALALALALAPALALARGIAIGFLGLVPGKPAINQALAAESSAADQGFYFSEALKVQETVWMGWPVGDNKAGKY